MGFDDCNRPEAFSNLVRGGRRGWTVMNALDGLDEEQRRFVYAGYSAGPCVLAPSLAGLDLCDSPEDCQATYDDVRVRWPRNP